MIKKKFLFFFLLASVSAYANVFMLSDKENVLYDGTYPLHEYLLQTQQGDTFHYLSLVEPNSAWSLQTKEKDFHSTTNISATIDILDESHKMVARMTGSFLDGFWINPADVSGKVIKRFSDLQQNQYLDVLIDEDETLGIRYILQGKTSLDNEHYGAFDFCHPFEIIMQTNNKNLLQNQEAFSNLFGIVRGYAQTFCPQTSNIFWQITDSPSLDSQGVFFFETFVRNFGESQWHLDQKVSFDYTKHLQVSSLDNVEDIFNLSQKLKKEQEGTFAIHVSSHYGNNFFFVDKPMIMKSLDNKLNLQEGWYTVQGSIEPLSDFEKKKSGLSLNEKSALVKIKDATFCKKEECQN